MYEKFSDNARQALKIAHRVANEAGHDYISTAHLLLGVLDDASGVASRALANCGVDVATFRSDVERLAKFARDDQSVEAVSRPSTKQAVEMAFVLAAGMEHELVDCEHFLLGLLQGGEGLAAQLLSKQGITFEALSAEVAKLRDAAGDHRPS